MPKANKTNDIIQAIACALRHNSVRDIRSSSIAKEAGTTELTIYRYFSSLDEMFTVTLEEGWRRIVVAAQAATFTNPSLSAEVKLIAEFRSCLELALVPDAQNLACAAACHHLSIDLNYPSKHKDMFNDHVMNCLELINHREHSIIYYSLMNDFWNWWRKTEATPAEIESRIEYAVNILSRIILQKSA
ncbi:MAG: TetR/AcrR family transcriptional regulator [Candidatus Saccharibacteria bacterium]